MLPLLISAQACHNLNLNAAACLKYSASDYFDILIVTSQQAVR